MNAGSVVGQQWGAGDTQTPYAKECVWTFCCIENLIEKKTDIESYWPYNNYKQLQTELKEICWNFKISLFSCHVFINGSKL